jgi:hypothetical protein
MINPAAERGSGGWFVVVMRSSPWSSISLSLVVSLAFASHASTALRRLSGSAYLFFEARADFAFLFLLHPAFLGYWFA